MVCRCARRVEQLEPQGHRHVPAATYRAAGAPAPLSQDRSACCSREQTGIGSVCAAALWCHPTDLPLSTSLYRGCINKLLDRQRVSKAQISERTFRSLMKTAAYAND